MDDGTHDLYTRGIAAAKAGERKEACFYLEWLLRMDPPSSEKMEAMYWLSEVSQESSEQFNYIEEILANNPGDARARRKLAILQGKIDPAEIIDPDKVPASAINNNSRTDAKRFICPTCGGKMVYTPDGQSLTCEFCSLQQKMNGINGSVHDKAGSDFIIAMATLKGHTKPTAMNVFSCQGCGANFIIPPEKITVHCPYCQSDYVIEQTEQRDLQAPDALIPLLISEEQAKKALRQWFDEENFAELPRVASGHPFYFPVWCFEMAGMIHWKCFIQKRNETTVETGESAILQRDILVSASRNLNILFANAKNDFNLEHLVLYDERFLASCLAETYQISVADASLEARKITLDCERQKIRDSFFEPIEQLQVDSSQMQVQSFRLVLFPFWLTHFDYKDKRFDILINGQTEKVSSTYMKNGLSHWIGKLFNPP